MDEPAADVAESNERAGLVALLGVVTNAMVAWWWEHFEVAQSGLG